MRAIIKFFLRRKLLVNILLIAIFVLAIRAVLTTTRNQFPEVDLSAMLITTLYPGASPRDVEENVTRLIEEELQGIVGLDKFASVSSEDVSVITVRIDINYPNQEEVKDEIRRAVDRVSDLPNEVRDRPEVRDLKSSELPVLTIGVFGDADYSTLRKMAKIIDRDLRNIKGVSKVEKYGYRDPEFQVDLNPDLLVENYVALSDVAYALENRNVRSTGGQLESYRTQRNILTLSEFNDIDEVKEAIVRSAFTGQKLRIKDVADVHEGFSDEEMRTGFNAERGISLVIKKSAKTDIIDLVDRLNRYVAEKQAVMPPDVQLMAVNDGSTIVRNRLDIVVNNGIFGFILVVLILVIFLSFRASFWIAMSIPTALGVALILMPLFGVDMNSISLAAMIIVLGMLVDDSIVVSENIFYKRSREGLGAFEASVEGTYEVFKPVIATILTTALAFAPMFAMAGIMGRFIYVIPVVVIAALFGSLLDCFMILPSHLYHSKADFAASDHGWRGQLFTRIREPYSRILKHALRHRVIVVTSAFLLLFFSLWWGGRMVGINLFPTDGADIFYVYVEMEEDATFDKTNDTVRIIEEAISELPEHALRHYTTRIGTDTSDELMEQTGGQEHLAFIKVTLSPISERSREADVIMDELRTKVANKTEAEKLRFEVEKPGPPAGTPIEFHVHGDNDAQRMKFVERMVKDLEAMKGVSDVNSTHKIGREDYKLNLDYDRLAAVGLTVNDVASTLRLAFDGVDATAIVRDNQEVRIRIRFPPKYRQDVRNVLDILVRNKDGKLVPLGSFATLDKMRAESSIHHTDSDVTTTIYAQTDGVTILPMTAITRLLDKYNPELKSNPDISFTYVLRRP